MKNSRSKPVISLFIHCYPPAKGGAEYLAEKFVEVLNQKHNVHLFTGRGETLDSYKTFDHYLPTEPNLNIHRLELNQPLQRIFNKLFNKIIFIFGHFSPFYFGPILKYTNKEIDIILRSDIIFGIAMPTKSFYDAYYFARKFNRKLILVPCYHNINYYNNCLFFQKAFDYATKVFFLTHFERNELLKNYYIKNLKLVQTTFCPFTKKEINNQQKFLPSIIKKHQQNFKNKQITIGYIGQITLRKNLYVFKDYLDKYLSEWQSKGFNLRVYLSGAKTNSSIQVETIFKEYIDQKIVTINYDFLSEDKEKEFSKIDIFVNPSEEESLGIVNFEAIYYGCQLIVKSNSAFDSLDSSLKTFTNTESLHLHVLNNIKHQTSNHKSILKIYTYDLFKENVNNSLTQIM